MTELQKVILDIFKVVAEICERNNIKYFAIGGTCLGAVRHKGFIPWDDDMDIAIPIEQYDKLKKCLKEQLPENLYLLDARDDREYVHFFMKVCDKNTTFVEDKEENYPNLYKGVYLDIMPMSGIPEDAEERAKFKSLLRKYHKMNYVRKRPFRVMKTLTRKLAWIFAHGCKAFIPYWYFYEKKMNELRKYPLKDAKTCAYVWVTSIDKHILSADDFRSTVRLPFEDTFIECPSGWDGFLTSFFGNYMELPPVEKRKTHAPYILDLHKSYLEYKEAYKK